MDDDAKLAKKIKAKAARLPVGTKAADLDADEDLAKADKEKKKAEEEKAAHVARVMNGDAQKKANEPDTKPANPKALAAQMEHKEEIDSALEQIKTNVKQSEQALKGHEEHINELNDIIKHEADGRAKDELAKVRDYAKKHAKDIEDHIKSGKKLI